MGKKIFWQLDLFNKFLLFLSNDSQFFCLFFKSSQARADHWSNILRKSFALLHKEALWLLVASLEATDWLITELICRNVCWLSCLETKYVTLRPKKALIIIIMALSCSLINDLNCMVSSMKINFFGRVYDISKFSSHILARLPYVLLLAFEPKTSSNAATLRDFDKRKVHRLSPPPLPYASDTALTNERFFFFMHSIKSD